MPKANDFVSRLSNFPEYLQPFRSNGSNNWAVSGKRTKSGYSLLSNDTHLSYGLPTIWYEMQLVAPELNVYGATFPASRPATAASASGLR